MNTTRKIKRGKLKQRKTIKSKAIGGYKFPGLQTISSGVEGYTFKTQNGKLLKIPRLGKLNPNEVSIQERLISLGLPYFPSLYETSTTTNSIGYENLRKKKNNIREFGNGIGSYSYNYILMEYVDGKPIKKYLNDKISNSTSNNSPTDAEINLIKNEIINIYSKLAFALYVADKVFNYRHRDFHDNNCLIKEDGTPVIIDFGSNRMPTNSKRNKIPSSKDMLHYIDYSIDYYTYASYKKLQKIIRILSEGEFKSLKDQTDDLSVIIQRLVKIKTGEDQPFQFEESFRTLGIPEDILQIGKDKIQTRTPMPDTSETRLAEKLNAKKQLLNAFKEKINVEKFEEGDPILQSLDTFIDTKIAENKDLNSLFLEINDALYDVQGTKNEKIQEILNILKI